MSAPTNTGPLTATDPTPPQIEVELAFIYSARTGIWSHLVTPRTSSPSSPFRGRTEPAS
jgi:hypothetical protein